MEEYLYLIQATKKTYSFLLYKYASECTKTVWETMFDVKRNPNKDYQRKLVATVLTTYCKCIRMHTTQFITTVFPHYHHIFCSVYYPLRFYFIWVLTERLNIWVQWSDCFFLKKGLVFRIVICAHVQVQIYIENILEHF